MKVEIVLENGKKEIFNNVVSFHVIEGQTGNQKVYNNKKGCFPTECKLFKVNLVNIDRSIFKEPMEDKQQELTRQYIMEAFNKVDKQPEKYAAIFYTLMPNKTWDGSKSRTELMEYAKSKGGHMADQG